MKRGRDDCAKLPGVLDPFYGHLLVGGSRAEGKGGLLESYRQVGRCPTRPRFIDA